jgi:hypothetical protein
MRRVLGELGNWRDYFPAAFWALLTLAVAVAGPVLASLT